MERPVFQPLGTPVEQLDTPALVVDLACMEQNIESLHAFFLGPLAKVRPHVTSHKCPAIAHKQLAAPATVGGISVSRVSEAEVFAEAGFTDILVAGEIVTRSKINRLCSLARPIKMMVVVDNPNNVRDLSEAAGASGVTLHVLVDVNVALDHPGVEPGQPALDLAKAVARAGGLRFAGLTSQAFAGSVGDGQGIFVEGDNFVQPVLDTRDMVERDGLEVEVLSVGGDFNYEIVGAMSGVTEVRPGSYPLMDYDYCQRYSQFKPAARVLVTVISHPVDGLAVSDAGHKAMGPDRGLPVVEGVPGASMTRMSAEHGVLHLEGESQKLLDAGKKVWLIPWEVELCVNQYNYIHATRNGKLEAVWEIAGRGRFE